MRVLPEYKYHIHYKKLFRKQYQQLKKRGYDMSLINDVVDRLAKGETLSPKHRDHPLLGKRKGYRDCHIKDDWILIYRVDKDVLILILSETGTHADTLE